MSLEYTRIRLRHLAVALDFAIDVIAEAAALWESLSQNHPFVDGNKRTAIAATAAHLAINGYWLRQEEM